jgi:tetratricopeptide (TPR) repeat protein
MTFCSRLALVGGFLLAVCTVAPAISQPESVPRLTERGLDKASYVQLAKEWKQYIEQNGESADALANLALAYKYSEEQDAAVIAAKRAVELGPDNPKALALLGEMLAVWVEDEEAALEVLQRCREVAPDYEFGLTMLATAHLRRGELSDADEVFQTVFDQRVIATPLQDFAYNMLVGLPRGAVLITSGDNDTFPPLALQSGMEFRRDVIVINRSLLNLPEYARALFKLHPSITPEYKIDKHETRYSSDGHAELLSNKLIEKMIEEKKAPVYFAASANREYSGFSPDLYIEGMNFRTSAKGLSAEESARLFLDTYRLDSATDWSYAWSLMPKVSQLVGNYAASMIKLAESEGLTAQSRLSLLDKASDIAGFHDLTEMSYYIKSIRK